MFDVATRIAQSAVAGWVLVAAAGVAPAQEGIALEPLPTLVAEGFQFCWQASLNPATVSLTAGAMGWDMDPAEDYGPFVQMLYGSRDYDGFGEASIVISSELFPHRRIGYCQFQVELSDSMDADVGLIESLGNLRGRVETARDGVYGMFEEDVDAPTIFVSAYQVDDRLTIAVTRVNVVDD